MEDTASRPPTTADFVAVENAAAGLEPFDAVVGWVWNTSTPWWVGPGTLRRRDGARTLRRRGGLGLELFDAVVGLEPFDAVVDWVWNSLTLWWVWNRSTPC